MEIEAEDEEVPVLVHMADENDDEDDDAPQLVVMDSDNEDVDLTTSTQDVSSAEDYVLPCPVTILAGFLGSGKTTLIQYILQSPNHGKRIAVIENEFGGGSDGISVESMIARDGAQSLTDLIELPNGCVCCTVKDNLVQTLEKLLEKRQDLDYILIESSGMANPGPIASIFWLDDALESRIRLDGIVTLVDANNIVHQLHEMEEAAQQIAYADRILLNKVDLVDDKKQQEAVQLIRTINPTVPIQTTTYSKVLDLDWILDSNCFSRAMELDQEAAAAQQPFAADQYCMPVTIPAHKHTNAIGTITLTHNGTVDMKKINAWLASLLWPNQDENDTVLRGRLESSEQSLPPSGALHATPEEVDVMQLFRIKGILSVKHSELMDEDKSFVNHDAVDHRRFIVQGVYDLWDIHPASDDLKWETGEPRVCKLIVIGKNLQTAKLHSSFIACFV